MTAAPAPARAAFADLLQRDLRPAVISTCFAACPPNRQLPLFARLQFRRPVADAFREILIDVLDDLRDLGDDLDLIKYDPGSRPDSYEVECLEVAGDDQIGRQVAELLDPAGIEVLDREADIVDQVRYYAIIAQDTDGTSPSLFFRQYHPGMELTRSKWVSFILGDGHLTRVEQPIFLFERDVDCIVHAGWLFILRKDATQKLFRFFDELKRKAHEFLMEIEDKVPIANFAEFEAACMSHLQKLSKLKNISQRGHLKQVKVRDLRRIIDAYDLDVRIRRVQGEDMLVFDKKNPWAILKLLDEDFFESSLSKTKFEATGKRQIGG